MALSTTSKYFLNVSRHGDSSTSLESLFQHLTTLTENEAFLISNLDLPRNNLRPLPLILSLVTWEKRPTPTSTNMATTIFQVVEESDKVSAEPPLPQTEKSQFPQLLLRRLELQNFHSFVALLWTYSRASVSFS